MPMPLDLTKFVGRFAGEAGEHIRTINNGLLSLEKNPDDPDTLKAVYRAMHTIKGGSRIIKLTPITQVAHKMEDILDGFIKGRLHPSKELLDLLFQGVDAIGLLLDKVSAGERVSEPPAGICEALEKAVQGDTEGETEPPKSPDTAATPEKTDLEPKAAPDEAGSKKTEALVRKPPAPADTIRVNPDKLDALINLTGEIACQHQAVEKHAAGFREIKQKARQHLDLISGTWEDNDVLFRSAQSLFTAVSLVAAQIREHAASGRLLVSELQDRSLHMRMLPLSGIFDTFRRAVRDMARSQGKEVAFSVSGGETELDKKIIDRIGDALLHMIRNAVDHGIETPDQRIAAGKGKAGRISLSAWYHGGNVLIELADDGAGIPLDAIRKKAFAANLVNTSDLERMADTDIINLIFHPGFSTSPIITDISGRGVGMDVVKKEIIENFKGDVDIRTETGKGSCFTIRLPLTMAVMDILTVSVAGHVFAFPAASVKEIVRIPETGLIRVVDRTAIRLREQIIPVVFLTDVCGLKEKTAAGEQEPVILVAAVKGEALGILVDSLLDQDDMVIKPLPGHMKNNKWVSGAIISENHGLVSVLHIPAIADAAKRATPGMPIEKKAPKTRKHILVVDDSISTREIEKSILESHGYVVSLAVDGQDALEKTGVCQYDLLIVDIEMPRLDGFSLTGKLRKEKNYQKTPIILVTSRDKKEDIRRGMQVGADAYIIKGDFEESNLVETIKNLLG